MKKLKIKILKDHEASLDGIKLTSFKKDEVLELGTSRLSLHLYDWHTRNSGFSEIVEEKAQTNAPENKMIKNLENKNLAPEAEEEIENTPINNNKRGKK